MGNKLINIWFSKKHDSSYYVAFNQSNTISRNNYPTVYRIKRNIIVIIGRRNDWNSKHITHNPWMYYGMKSSKVPVSFSWSSRDLFVPWREAVCFSYQDEIRKEWSITGWQWCTIFLKYVYPESVVCLGCIYNKIT